MALGEFELIERFFARSHRREDVVLGTGDDCALLRPPPDADLAVTVDTLMEGVHFPAGTDAAAVGHKTLAASLSDLAAMGAAPAWAVLSLSVPDGDIDWLQRFSAGLFGLAERYGLDVVGGDTVRGPRVLTLQATGFVPRGEGMRRSGARPGDRVYVTGTLGDAGLGLALVQGKQAVPDQCGQYLRDRLDRPEPRVREGCALLGLASAAIDISDGLAADLGHILEASGVGATLQVDALPRTECLRDALNEADGLRMALTAGDDYELCFTVPPERCPVAEERLRAMGCPCTVIGVIEERPGLRLQSHGEPYEAAAPGYNHFRSGGGT